MDDELEHDLGPSKSQLKRDAHDLLALGEELAALPAHQLAAIALADELRDAVAAVRLITAHGARNYSIFLDPATRQLFGYVEIESEARWNAVAQTEVCRRWWKHMRDLMPSNPDNSPVSTELTEVFHLE